MNWRDLSEGDHVRVTFELPVDLVSESYLILGSIDDGVAVDATVADAATWELLDPPLRVGRAQYKPSEESCDVLATHGGLAWVKFDNETHRVTTSDLLVNIDEEPKP